MVAKAESISSTQSRSGSKRSVAKKVTAPRKGLERSAKRLQGRSSARLEARIPDDQKQEFERAAGILHMTLTEFIITTLTDAAKKVIKDHQILTLSKTDTENFVAALLSPSAPNESLLQAAKQYKEQSHNV